MDHARRLRNEATDAEARLWARLRNHQLGAKFRRQHRAEGFIVDFACPEHMLVVELDGGQHAERAAQDEQRTQRLQANGWRVLRFWNHQALVQTDDVLSAIWAALQKSPPPAPSASIRAIHARARLNALIRTFFAERNILEVETPLLSQAGNTDPNIESFPLQFSGRTDGAPRTRWLRTSPEFALKRLLAAGVGDCYELGRVFRDGEAGVRHNPEFTMLEWYRLGWDHRALMIETAALVNAALALVGRAAGYAEIRYDDLYRNRLGIDPQGASDEALRQALGDVQIDPKGLTRDDWLDLLMTHRLQPGFRADQLLAVYDFPASQCALARLRIEPGKAVVAERFELYLGPLELANGYHELADAMEQGERFDRDLRVRQRRGQPGPPRDERLLQAMAAGLPDCAGVALGVDRLLMAMLGTACIGDVLAFDFARS
ncbi:MAG: EF-P lysine aminoacylase GenX [Lysobacter sp.]|nr:EF-P lysine aminoacylase GenX [Lysobacter sp.]